MATLTIYTSLMKDTFLLYLCLFSFPALLSAQTTCNCLQDLDYLYPLVKKTVSYKDQIKGAKASSFEANYDKLRKQSTEERSLYDCFQLLVQLLAPIKDNHMYLQGEMESVSSNDLRDPDFLDAFRQNPAYEVLPKPKVNLVDLEQQLKKKALAELEGIYYYRDIIKIGLYQQPNSDQFYGVVLQSALPSWQPGEVLMVLKKKSGKRYQVIAGQFMNRALIHYDDMVGPGNLYTYGWSKITNTKPNYQKIYTEKTFDLLDWSEDIQYLRIGNFSNSPSNTKKARQFVKNLASKLNTPKLVVDLRNNIGGARKVSLPFYKALKDYHKRGEIWVLVNYMTVSNAEQFTVKLKKLKGTQIIGMTTNGTISYGRNRSNTQVLPSGYFAFRSTDMNFSNFLEYEEKGIQPDIKVDPDRDWKKQVLEIIQ